jgi:hypothetical protein
MYSAYLDMCDAASPTLESFYAYYGLKTNRKYLLPIAAPALVSLTIHGNLPLFLDDLNKVPLPVPPPIFPALRYLSFTGFSDHPSHLFEHIALQAPNLTHLILMPTGPTLGLQRDFNSARSKSDSEQPNSAIYNEGTPRLSWQSIERVYIQGANQPSLLQPRKALPRTNRRRTVEAPAGTNGPTPEAAQKQWIDAQGEKAFIPLRCLLSASPNTPNVAQVFTSTTEIIAHI